MSERNRDDEARPLLEAVMKTPERPEQARDAKAALR
jgi:hypothetical protein